MQQGDLGDELAEQLRALGHAVEPDSDAGAGRRERKRQE